MSCEWQIYLPKIYKEVTQAIRLEKWPSYFAQLWIDLFATLYVGGPSKFPMATHISRQASRVQPYSLKRPFIPVKGRHQSMRISLIQTTHQSLKAQVKVSSNLVQEIGQLKTAEKMLDWKGYHIMMPQQLAHQSHQIPIVKESHEQLVQVIPTSSWRIRHTRKYSSIRHIWKPNQTLWAVSSCYHVGRQPFWFIWSWVIGKIGVLYLRDYI